MTVDELNKRLDRVSNEIQSRLGNTMIQIGNDALYKIKERIQGSGVNAKGEKFKPYSTKEMLVGGKSFRKKDATMFFNRKGLDWKSLRKPGVGKPPEGKHNKKSDYVRLAVLPGGYKQLREISGLQASFVDFTFTTDMWSNIGIVSDVAEANKGIVRISAKTEKEKKKLEGNTARRGNILELSDKELAEVSETFGMRLQQIIDKNGL
ncbi:MAG: hypothetical protein ABFC18_03110 [Rikenellaceae bacterium]